MGENKEIPYRKPTRDEIPYTIAERSVFKPEGREDERGLYISRSRGTPEVMYMHREYWDAEPPKSIEYLSTPVSHIRFTYTNSPPCHDMDECMKAIKELQSKHMEQGLSDIKYNFLVGGDGTVYEGRGWNAEPDRPEKFADLKGKALDIAYIGNFKTENPCWEMEKSAHHFIQYGVDELIIERRCGITSYRD